MDVIKVSAHSRTSAVAGAIAGVFREYGRAEVQAIGAGAVNQSVKALILAMSYLKERDGIEVACTPEFVDVDIEGNVRTAIKLVVVDRLSLANAEVEDLDLLDEAEAESDSQLMEAPDSDLLDTSAF